MRPQPDLAQQSIHIPYQIGVEIDPVDAPRGVPPAGKGIHVRYLAPGFFHGCREGDVPVEKGGRPDGLGFGSEEVVG